MSDTPDRLPDDFDPSTYIEKWRSIALCCEPADRPRAEAAFEAAYRQRGLEWHGRVEWFDSPLAAARRQQELTGSSSLLGSPTYGQHGAGWLSYADVLQPIVKNPEFPAIAEAAASCGWWWALDGAVIASERTSALHYDEQRRLHHPTQQAVEYRDGYGFCYWHGVQVPHDWILNGPPPASEVLAHANAEVRRAGAEIIGWEKVLEEIGAVVVDEDEPHIGTLLRARLPGADEDDYFLKCECGTGRTFALPVDSSLRTAKAANNWTYGRPADAPIYKVRT